FYWGEDRKPYNLVRFHGREIMTMQEYAHLERVEGYYGGQMASFEAVFSPRGPDGQPLPLFDRDTGRIDPLVQKYWEDHYDITRLLQRNWSTLGPKLRGRLRSEEHTSELQSPYDLVCRLLLEKKKTKKK